MGLKFEKYRLGGYGENLTVELDEQEQLIAELKSILQKGGGSSGGGSGFYLTEENESGGVTYHFTAEESEGGGGSADLRVLEVTKNGTYKANENKSGNKTSITFTQDYDGFIDMNGMPGVVLENVIPSLEFSMVDDEPIVDDTPLYKDWSYILTNPSLGQTMAFKAEELPFDISGGAGQAFVELQEQLPGTYALLCKAAKLTLAIFVAANIEEICTEYGLPADTINEILSIFKPGCAYFVDLAAMNIAPYEVAFEIGTDVPDPCDGYSEITVNVQPKLKLTTLSVTENGTYNIEEGYDGYSTVEVNTPANLFIENNNFVMDRVIIDHSTTKITKDMFSAFSANNPVFVEYRGDMVEWDALPKDKWWHDGKVVQRSHSGADGSEPNLNVIQMNTPLIMSYNEATDSYTVTGCNFVTSCIAIPSVASDGKPVVGIAKGAFSSATNVQTLVVPFVGGSMDSNKFLGYIFGASSENENGTYVPASLKRVVVTEETVVRGFRGCSNIESVEYLGNVTRIWEHAFSLCSNLSEFIIPESVVTIGQQAFRSCTKLNNVEFPIGVTCVNIPSGVESIGSSVFAGCTLTHIDVPVNLSDIEFDTFSGAVEGAIVNMPNVDKFIARFGSAFSKSYKAYVNGEPITDITVPMEGNRYKAYSNCSTIKNVTIPKNTTCNFEEAFKNCSSIESVVIEDGHTNDGTTMKDMLRKCTSLKNIVIPDSMRFIDEYMFAESGLESITIGSGITNIGQQAFYKCVNLMDVYYNGTIEQWNNITKDAYCWQGTPISRKVHCTDGDV